MTHASRRCLTVLMLTLVLAGCSTTRGQPDARDPFEGFNRAMFTFNDKLDQVALKPVATVYQTILPSFVQTAVGNFFGNMGDVWTAFNHFLQGNIEKGLSDTMRVAVNTTFGFAGVLDISSEAGLPKHKQDLGLTLGVWGVPSGPYVVLPVLGSSTLRDSVMVPLDYKGDPWGRVTPVHTRNAGTIVQFIDRRAVFLDASNLLEDAAFDRYEFVKDAFLQQRASKVDDSRGDDAYDEGDYDAYDEGDYGDYDEADAGADEQPPAPDSESAPSQGNESDIHQQDIVPDAAAPASEAIATPLTRQRRNATPAQHAGEASSDVAVPAVSSEPDTNPGPEVDVLSP